MTHTKKSHNVSDKIRNTQSENFDSRLFTELNKEQDHSQSFVFSPYSIKDCITLSYDGMNEGAKKELASLGITGKEVNDIAGFDKKVRNVRGLDIANHVFYNQKYKPYINIGMIRKNGSEPVNVGEPAKTAAHINDWISDNTGGRINSLVSPDSISPYTAMFLTNAIYMNMKWKNSDDYDETGNVYWKKDNQDYKSFTGGLPLGDVKIADKASLIRLPYKTDKNLDMNMYLILPSDEKTDISEWLNEKHDYKSLLNFNKNKRRRLKNYDSADFNIPNFSIRYTNTKMTNTLKKIGLDERFTDTPHLDYKTYNKLLKNTNPDLEGLYVSNVSHEAYMKVNKNGTEAAAATVEQMDALESAAVSEDTTFHFVCNRPFAIVVKEENSDQVLFMGRIESDALEKR